MRERPPTADAIAVPHTRRGDHVLARDLLLGGDYKHDWDDELEP